MMPNDIETGVVHLCMRQCYFGFPIASSSWYPYYLAPHPLHTLQPVVPSPGSVCGREVFGAVQRCLTFPA